MNLAELKSLKEKITPGEWEFDELHDACCGRLCTPNGSGCHESHPSGEYQVWGLAQNPEFPDRIRNKEDAELISLAPELLSELIELKEWKDGLVKGLTEMTEKVSDIKISKLTEKQLDTASGFVKCLNELLDLLNKER